MSVKLERDTEMPTPTLEYRTADKSAWGDGPWQREPDKRQWTDEATGLPCLIVRNSGITGALCGYVGVAPGHPAHGADYSFWGYGESGERLPLTPLQEALNAVEVHGGLTFSGACGHGGNPAEGICHIPGAGEPDTVWWFGFDCAHAGDYSPAMDHSRRGFGALGSPTGWGGVITYRDQAYVEAAIRSLAKQLLGMATVSQSSEEGPLGAERSDAVTHPGMNQ